MLAMYVLKPMDETNVVHSLRRQKNQIRRDKTLVYNTHLTRLCIPAMRRLCIPAMRRVNQRVDGSSSTQWIQQI